MKIKEFWQMRWEGSELPPLRLRPGFCLKSFEPDKDEAMLTELQNTAFGENWGFSPNTVEQIAARVRTKISPPKGIIFIMDGENAAAYNWTQRIQNARGHVGFVAMTGVHPSYRGSGLGTAIVVSGMKHLVSEGVNAIELEVDAENTPARELYLKLGYRRVHPQRLVRTETRSTRLTVRSYALEYDAHFAICMLKVPSPFDGGRLGWR